MACMYPPPPPFCSSSVGTPPKKIPTNLRSPSSPPPLLPVPSSAAEALTHARRGRGDAHIRPWPRCHLNPLPHSHAAIQEERRPKGGRKEGGGRTCYSVHTRIRYITAAFFRSLRWLVVDGSVAVPGTSFSIASRGEEGKKGLVVCSFWGRGKREKRRENRAMFFGARPTSFYRGGKCGALQQKKRELRAWMAATLGVLIRRTDLIP